MSDSLATLVDSLVQASLSVTAATDPGASGEWFTPQLVGVLIGSGISIIGGFLAQWYRANIEDQRDRRQLKRYFEHALRGSISLLLPLKVADPHRPRSFHTGRQLLPIWASYDRMADRIALFRKAEFQTRLHVFVLMTRMAAEGLIYADDLVETGHREADSGSERSLLRKKENDIYALDIFKSFHESIDQRVTDAEALLKELERQ